MPPHNETLLACQTDRVGVSTLILYMEGEGEEYKITKLLEGNDIYMCTYCLHMNVMHKSF